MTGIDHTVFSQTSCLCNCSVHLLVAVLPLQWPRPLPTPPPPQAKSLRCWWPVSHERSDLAPIEKGLETSGLGLQNSTILTGFPSKRQAASIQNHSRLTSSLGHSWIVADRSSDFQRFDRVPSVPACQLADPSHLLRTRLLTAFLFSSRHRLSYLFYVTHIGRSPCAAQPEARAKILPKRLIFWEMPEP